MRKVSLLLAFAVAGLSGFAQYNTPSQERHDAQIAKRTISSEDLLLNKSNKTTQAAAVKAPGDVLYSFTFDSGLPAGWSVSDDAGIGGWEYYQDSARSAAYTTERYVMINSTSGGGYMLFPVEYYNTVGGSWPPVDVSPLIDGDATMTTDWMDVTGIDNVSLRYASWFKTYYGAYDIYIYVDGDDVTPVATLDGATVNGTYYDYGYPGDVDNYDNLTTGDGFNCVFPEYKISDAVGVPFTSVKIAFRVHSTSHYSWSIDDVELYEPLENDIELSEVYARNFWIYTNHPYFDGTTEGVYTGYNTNYSEAPANIVNQLFFGGYIHQYGLNAETAQIDFAIDSADQVDFWTGTSNVIADFGAVILTDTILVSDTTVDGITVVPEFYNTDIDQAWFENNNFLENGVPYVFNYTASSTGAADLNQDNNSMSYDYAQTWGRYSYHWQTSVDADVYYNSAYDTDGYTSFDPANGDILFTEFECYQDDAVAPEDAFKIYGLRFYLPDWEYYVTFDAAGNGAFIKPVLYFWDVTLNAGAGDWAEFNTDDVLGSIYPLHMTDVDTWVYLEFDNSGGEIDNATFPNTDYRIGVKIEDYNGQKFAVATDDTHRQPFGHAITWAAGQATPDYARLGTDGAVMIDMYTRADQMAYDQTVGVKEVSTKAIDNVKVYPNPTTGLVNVQNAENATINVYSITGNLVSTTVSNSVTTTIDLSNLAKGTYLVKIVKENEVITKKINLLK